MVIGYVNRRVASDRVEVTVHDARFLDAESQFRPDKGLVYVRDNGQTRLGEFIQAVLRDSENQIATHDYDKAADKLASCYKHLNIWGHIPSEGWPIIANKDFEF